MSCKRPRRPPASLRPRLNCGSGPFVHETAGRMALQSTASATASSAVNRSTSNVSTCSIDGSERDDEAVVFSDKLRPSARQLAWTTTGGVFGNGSCRISGQEPLPSSSRTSRTAHRSGSKTLLFRGIRHNTSRSCHLNMWGLAYGRVFRGTPARLLARPTRPQGPRSPATRRTLCHDRADLISTTMSGQAADTQPDAVSAARDTWPVGHALTAKEAARVAGVHERTIRRAIARGELPAAKRAGIFQIAPEALVQYRARHRRTSPPLSLLRLVEHAPGSAFALPTPLTSFLGRERDIAAVTAALSQPDLRLLTLTGPGGTGKTRLALRVAEELAPRFPDGVAFVPLAAVADPLLIPSAIAQQLGVRERGDRPIGERLIAALHDRRLLLVLDNFEHVLPAAPFVAELLAACPALSILVTSRTMLRLSGEQRFPVPPMTLPDPTITTTATAARQADAVQLFVQRAQAAQPGFVLTDENAGIVAAICRRLDGLPLAIELAAARIPVLPQRALLDRLDRRLLLLTGGPLDAPACLRTMRDAIAWSYDLLPSEEQLLFRRLAVFMGGCTLEAATALAGGGIDVLEGISALVASSLLRQEDGSGGESRFLMLETVREFGLERLAASELLAAS